MAPTVWYHVRNLDAGRRFYQDVLGFEELAVDFEARWSELRRGEMEIGLAEGEPGENDGVAHVDVTDLKQEAERLRRGVVPALPGLVPRVRLRGRGDAGTDDRRRPEQARPRHRRRAARGIARASEGRRLLEDQPQRRAGPDRLLREARLP